MSRPSRFLSLAFVAASLAAPSLAHAQVSQIGRGRNFGLGLVFGWPNVGVGLNAYISQLNSLQVDLTWSYRSGYGYFGARADFLFWMPRIASTSYADLRWYVGPGLNLGIVNGLYNRPDGKHYDGGFFLEAEVPIGIGLQFKFPLDVMLEAVPRLYIFDTNYGAFLGINIAAAVNVRYYF